MGDERINGEQPGTIEWGGAAADRLGWFTTDRPAIRGAGVGCALAGFGMLVAAQLLPWMSIATTPLEQDFPTTTGGRISTGLAQLQVPHEIFNLGWLVVLGLVATALAVSAPVRRVVLAAGLGLVAGQLALLAGITYGVLHVTNPRFLGGTFVQSEVPVRLEPGLYCAYAAIALFALSLLLAGGVPRRLRDHSPAPDEADVGQPGPVDLTVTPLPTADPAVWSQRDADIEVSGRPYER